MGSRWFAGRAARAAAAALAGAAALACTDGGTDPTPAGAPAYHLVAVDGAVLPAAYARDADATARVFADTLVFTARAATEGTYAEVAHIGVTEGGGPEQRHRIAFDPLRAYATLATDSLELHGVGGPMRGLPAAGDSLVLWNGLREQRWSYRRVR